MKQAVDPYASFRELTLRGMILGALITVIFTASNVYLGLKVGLTFASSIPAAVISMAVLKFFKGSNILENNMVQTQASAAGTLSSIIFILPGLLMAGYWAGFPFWQTTLLCMSGGILGVIFTVPLRYAMVVKSDLPYPEGMDAAQALAAPQATLMTTIAQGIFSHNLQWDYIFTGVAIGVALIAVDFTLRKSSGGKRALPVLAVGMGIYLPPSVNMPIVIGAVLAAVLKSVIARRQENREGRLKNAERIGTLFSAGLIVGESLIGVIMAFIIAFSVTNGGSDAPLALNLENWDTAAKWLGLAFFVFGMFVFARRVLKAGR